MWWLCRLKKPLSQQRFTMLHRAIISHKSTRDQLEFANTKHGSCWLENLRPTVQWRALYLKSSKYIFENIRIIRIYKYTNTRSLRACWLLGPNFKERPFEPAWLLPLCLRHSAPRNSDIWLICFLPHLTRSPHPSYTHVHCICVRSAR